MKYWILVPVFLLIGCASQDMVKEGDRETLDQADKGISVAMEMIGAGDVKGAIRVMTEVQKNVKQLVKVYGGPKGGGHPFSEEAGKAARDQSEKEHAPSGWAWATVGLLALGLFREVGTSWCPFLGPVMDKFMPFLAGGATKNEKAVLASHEIIEGYKQYVPAEKQEEVKNFVDRVNSRYGVSTHATAIYQKYLKA